MKFLILSPWENDWGENVVGYPENYYFVSEVRNHLDIEVDWVYIGENHYKNLDNVRFIKFKDFKAQRKYDLILAFSYQFHDFALEISKKYNSFYINKHFGIALNPMIWNIRNPIIQLRYRNFLDCFKKQADFYVALEDGSNAKLFLKLFGIPTYKIRIYQQTKPDEVKFEPIYRKDEFINVGYIGAVSRYKGGKVLIDIFREILKDKKLHLIICTIRSEYNLRKILRDYENLTIIENLNYFQTYKFYSSIDFLINPVKYGNMTRPTVEAFSYGKPVIAFDVSLWTKIEHLKNGILIKPFDIKSFINWVFELSNNDELLKNLSKNALITSENIIKISDYTRSEIEFLKSFKV